MSELQTFFHMGGYAWFVWPSFLITFAVLLGNVWFARAQYRRVLRETTVRAATKAQKKSQQKRGNNLDES